jgi:hypothetical protein
MCGGRFTRRIQCRRIVIDRHQPDSTRLRKDTDMKLRTPSPAVAISSVALLLAAGGGTAVAANNWNPTVRSVEHLISHSTAGNATHFDGLGPQHFVRAEHFATSGGEHFLSAGQTVVLGKDGHFTFSSTCSTDSSGQNQVTFDVTANTTADLDGNGPMAAGTKINIHTDSDALDSSPGNTLAPGSFAQVGSASSSTEIAADGQEVDVFYNDGVNWPASGGSPSHECFAGYTGFTG